MLPYKCISTLVRKRVWFFWLPCLRGLLAVLCSIISSSLYHRVSVIWDRGISWSYLLVILMLLIFLILPMNFHKRISQTNPWLQEEERQDHRQIFLAHWIRVSEILSLDRISYLTYVIQQRLSQESCTLVVLELTHMVVKWCHCCVKVTSAYSGTSERLFET